MKPPKSKKNPPPAVVTETKGQIARREFVAPKPDVLSEALALLDADGETVLEFESALTTALCEGFKWPEGAYWYVSDIASDWCAVCVVEWDDEDGSADRDYWRVAYSRAGRKFSFGEWTPVIRRAVYQPKPADEDDDVDVPPAPKMEQRASEDTEQRDHIVDRFRLDEYAVTTGAQVTEKAPNGTPFVAVLRGEGGVIGEINLNGRLYDPKFWAENEDRFGDLVKKAWEAKDAASNGALGALVGPIDHSMAGPSIMTMGTVLLEAKRVGNRIKIALGFMESAPAQQALTLKKYGIPLGVSWEARGKFKKRVMDEKNPFYSSNRQHAGRQYDEVGPYVVERFALVMDPSAGTFLEQHAASIPSDVKALVESLCADGFAPVNGACACAGAITEAKDATSAPTGQEPDSMKPEVLEALKAMTPAQLKEHAPGLFDAVQSEAAAAVATEAKGTEDALKALREQADADRKALTEAQAKLADLEKQANEAKRQADVRAAIEAECVGKANGDKRRTFLTRHVLDKGLGADSIAEAVALLDEAAAAAVAEVPVNERAAAEKAAKADEGAAPAPALGFFAPRAKKTNEGGAR